MPVRNNASNISRVFILRNDSSANMAEVRVTLSPQILRVV